MIAPRRRFRTTLAAVRWGGAATAALALVALMGIGPGTASQAMASNMATTGGNNYNQMTGIGTTSSAVTVNWTSGLLNSSNTAITGTSSTDGGNELSPDSDRQAFAAGKSTSPLSFMYNDFKSLQVTVSQTSNITHQGVTVSWKGFAQTLASGTAQLNFLQLMECYGDSANGPSPENCEYGSADMLGSGVANSDIAGRHGALCSTGAVGSVAPSTTAPPTGQQDYGDPSLSCDTEEPAAESTAHCEPTSTTATLTCANGYFDVPFVPVSDPTAPIYEQSGLTTYFNNANSNEVQEAFSDKSGSGQVQFQTLTDAQAPGLGCGKLESNGKPRNCWLVIVPRGSYEPNGFHVAVPNPSGLDSMGSYMDSTPLSASNWAQRIQIHLDYAPLAANCSTSIASQGMVGAEIAQRAVASWQLELNQINKCNVIYSYTASTESAATAQLVGAGANSTNAGLALTTIPIGTETTRDGGSAPKLPKILYAPVGVSALGFGFNIDDGTPPQSITKPVNLTPALVAKALTQAYRYDLPDYDPEAGLAGPSWVQKNPVDLTNDPEFVKLNSTVPAYTSSAHTLAPLVVGGKSADNQRVWEWIDSDAATASWLDGKTDSSNTVTVDPAYTSLKLGASALDNFPQSYKGTITCGDLFPTNAAACNGNTGAELNTQSMLPVQEFFDSAASQTVAGSNPALVPQWNSQATAPNGTAGWWNSIGAEVPGQLFLWTVNALPQTAAYGLIPASLCTAAGTNCVQPTVTTVAAALKAATKDSAGLYEVNPAKVPAGAYPLVDVIYAAVPVDQSATTLRDYANFISYAAGTGQTVGSAPGDLPPGYLPLTSTLKSQAKSVVTQLLALAGPTSTPTPTHSATATHSATPTQSATSTRPGTATQLGSPTQSAGTSPGGGTTATSTPNPTSAASAAATSTVAAGVTPTSSASNGGPVIVEPSAQLDAGTTPRTSSGGIRLALVIVLIIGAAGAIAGSVLRFGSMSVFTRPRRRFGRT